MKPLLLPNTDWNNRDLWLCRGGGWGDLLAMTPLVQEILGRWPNCRLHIACGSSNHDLFHGLNVTCELIPVPFQPHLMVVDFEELVEGDPAAEKSHLIDLFADRAGIQITNRKIHYEVRLEEFNEAVLRYPKGSKPRIGVQFMASALYRTYPNMQFVIKELAKENEILVFGTPGQVEFKPHPNVHNLMADKLSFRQSAAVLSTCDVCVAPDSALVHLCAALDVPCVALYGPIPSSLRVSGDKTHGIDGTAPCAPCFFHADRSTDFPTGKPCAKEYKCIALDAIPVETVVNKVKQLIAQGTTPCERAPR